MPGLPPSSPRGVARNESTRSDSSAASNTSQSSNNKKVVSFNRSVRVKKYPRSGNNKKAGAAEEGKRFWFRVYKNRHRQSPDPGEIRPQVIYYGSNGHHHQHDDVISYHPNPSALNYPSLTSECGTQTTGRGRGAALLGNEFTPLHPSQMPSDPPPVRRNHVKKIVHRFNEEAVFQRQRSSEGEPLPSPPGSPRLHSTPKHIPAPPPPPPPPPIPPPGYETDRSPPPEGLFSSSRLKKNPIVNGVKVMFGMGANKKGGDEEGHALLNGKPQGRGLFKTEIVISDGSETDVKSPGEKFLYGDYQNGRSGNNALVKRDDHFVTSGDDGRGYYFYNDDDEDERRRSRYHVETFDSGNQLLFDTTDLNTATSKTDEGEFVSTVGEKHQLWQNNKRIVVYEEPSPRVVRRKAKSQSDLTHPEEKIHPRDDKLDKGVSTDELFERKPGKKGTLRSKDTWLGTFKSSTKDKGVQCSKIPLEEPEELYGFGRYKIIRPRNGVVSAYSNVADKTKHSDVTTTTNGKDSSAIYSQVDKSKKKKNSEGKKKSHLFSEDGRLGSLFKSRSEPLYIGPPPRPQQPDDELDDNFFEDRTAERVVKTSKKSFGFKLGAAKDIRSSQSYEEPDWYNIDGDVEAHQRLQHRKSSHRDIAEVRQELEEETDVSSLSNGEQQKRAGSVVRELDYRKREISYENVPRPGDSDADRTPASPGLWYRDADEDYRKEMAQSEVSYPAGNSVGSDRFYTVDRREKGSRKLPPPSPRAYTLDRRHLKIKDRQRTAPAPKILVNGKEVRERTKKRGEDPSSVQSDPLCVRGGLAAAYQARQRANVVRRSNSTASGLRGGSPRRLAPTGSSEMSAASSESESGRVRRPLVMYIPGVSHPDRASEAEDRVSSSIARSHSVMSPTRPPRRSGRGRSRDAPFEGGEEEDEVMPLASDRNRRKPPRAPSGGKQGDIKRRHSMPKDTKFSWLKWRIRGKPTREP